MTAPSRWLAVIAGLAGAVALVAQSSATGTGGGTMAPHPTGQMAGMRYLLGIWGCSVRLPSMTGGAAVTDSGSLAFSAAPGETIRATTRANDYSADGYYGYDAKAKSWWSTGIDNGGNVWHEASNDGKIYLGSTSMGGGATPIRDTFTKTSASKFQDVTEIQMRGTWMALADAVCTKP
jgi:hypothetical protein